MSNIKTIGIVGGVGPHAGLDLNEKIFSQTIARTDQEHLDVLLFSYSAHITDRTKYLIGNTQINPALGIYEVLAKLETAGAEVAGIPCNSSHVPHIWDEINRNLSEKKHRIKLVNMIEETGRFIKTQFLQVTKIGVLGTTGTVRSEVYTQTLSQYGYEIFYPDQEIQEKKVHQSIYNSDYGIKAQSSPVADQAKKNLYNAIDHLIEKKVEAIILGCTEIPIAIKDTKIKGRPIIDATLILARSLIMAVAPEKLQPISQ